MPPRISQRELRDLGTKNIIPRRRTRQAPPATSVSVPAISVTVSAITAAPTTSAAPITSAVPATPAPVVPGSFPVLICLVVPQQQTPQQQAIRNPVTVPPLRTPPLFSRSSSLDTSSSDASAARLAREIRRSFPSIHQSCPSPSHHSLSPVQGTFERAGLFEQVDRESDLSSRDFTPTLRLRTLYISMADTQPPAVPYSNNQYRRDAAFLMLCREMPLPPPADDVLSLMITDEIYGMVKGVYLMSGVATREANL
jgi:hypothetical protein